MKYCFRMTVLVAAVGVAAGAFAGTKTWKGTTSALASEGANWDPAGAPTAEDDVVLDSSSNNNPMTWDLNNGVKSWSQSDYTGTVTFQTGVSLSTHTCHGVDTGVIAGEKGFPISGDLALLSGTWTHPAQLAYGSSLKTSENYKQAFGTYRIIVSVGGNCEIGSGAKMDVDGKGFDTSGPGYSNSCASHGGFGGYNYVVTTAASAIYGSIKEPVSHGTGRSTVGGGAVKLTVAGSLTHNGVITAISPRTGVYAGAGGSIWVTAASLAGAGTMTADGGAGTITAGCGGGGRVAVYLTGNGADFSGYTGTTTARNPNDYGTGGTVYREKKSDEGAGELIVDGGSTAANSPKAYGNTACSTLLKPTYSGSYSHSFRKITLGKWSRLYVTAGQTLTVGEGGITGYASGNSMVCITGSTLNVPANFTNETFCLFTTGKAATINVGSQGDSVYTVASTGSMTLNGPTTLNGSLLVNGTLSHSGQSDSDVLSYTNRIDLTVTGDMTITANGAIDVRTAGYVASRGPGGNSSKEYGGTYGGVVPGSGRDVYGSILHPTELGSSGTVGYSGGAAKLTVAGTLTLNGSIKAWGTWNNGGSNGSGGSVWLTVGELAGTGTIDAKGGTYGGETARAAAGGSGGRIAVRQTVGNLAKGSCGITFDYSGGKSTGGSQSGTGTLYWETAADGLDHGTVYCSSKQLPPVGMPADELMNATVRVGATTVLSLIDDAAVGDFYLPAGAALNLAGHTLKVVSPAGKYRASVLGTVDESQGGTIDWPRKGFVFFVR